MTTLPRFALAAVAAVTLAAAAATPAHAQYFRSSTVVVATPYVYPAPVYPAPIVTSYVSPYVSTYSLYQPSYAYPAPAVGYSVSSYYAPVTPAPYAAYRVDYYGRRRVAVSVYGVYP
jgi:hypothetical protein